MILLRDPTEFEFTRMEKREGEEVTLIPLRESTVSGRTRENKKRRREG
jgi:hypothetical protein